MLKKTKKYLPFILVIVLAALYRYWQIDILPGGLFPDEAANGIDVNAILRGELQPFYERGNGREALFFYLLTPAVWLLGRTPFAHHLVVATVGVAVVAFTYLLVKRWFGTRMAVVASVLAAVSSWYVTMSRTAFRANLTPVFTVLFFYFATRVVQAKSRIDYWLSSILAGASFGLGFYTYISYRMMIPLVGAVFLALLIIDLRSSPKFAIWKKYWKSLAVGAIAFAVTMVPLTAYFVQNPEWIVGRSGQVSIFSEELNNGDVVGTFLNVVEKTFLGFITTGDLNWRHNVSGFPFLSFLIAPLFVGGMLILLGQSLIFLVNIFRRHKQKFDYEVNLKRLPFFILFLWFMFMLAPEVLTAEGIPHGLRLVGIIPVVFIAPALFIEEIAVALQHRAGKVKKMLFTSALVVLLLLESVYGAYLYFGIAANSSQYAHAFRSDLTEVSKYINLRDNAEQTYLVLDLFSEQTVQYMTTKNGQPYTVVDPGSLWNGPDMVRLNKDSVEEPSGLYLKSGDQVIFTQSTVYDIEAFKKHYPLTIKIYELKNKWGEVIMVVYQQP